MTQTWTIEKLSDGATIKIKEANSGTLYYVPVGTLQFTKDLNDLSNNSFMLDGVSNSLLFKIDARNVTAPVYTGNIETFLVTLAQLTAVSISGGSGSSTYAGNSPSTLTINGIASGTSITGLTLEYLLQNIYAPFQAPAFTSFSISGQSSLIQVGNALSGVKPFIWSTSNSGNVQPNSLLIRDVNANTVLVSSLANDGNENVNIGTIANSVPVSQSWRIEATNILSASFISSNFTVSSIYPFYYGKVSSSGAAPGVNRPVANQALINSGTEVISSSTGTLSVTFSSTSDDYIWFAIPSLSTDKTVWYIDTLNNGVIGGSVSPSGNLFPLYDSVSINSPSALWSGITYHIYIANYQSAVSAIMQLKNN
jgi:hypothetical protein